MHTTSQFQSLQLSELFSLVADSEEEAFVEIYKRYYDRVYQLAYVYAKVETIAEDTAQQLFLKLWERRNELSQVDNPEGWLFQAAKFQVWRMMEKEAGNENYRRFIMGTMTFSSTDPAETLIRKEGRERFKTFIDSLPAKQQQVYLLSREQGLTYQQIAASLGIGKETVKEHMSKALSKIREYFLGSENIIIIVLAAANFF